MDSTLVLGMFAGVVQITAFALYNRNIFFGTATPNTATWSLWFFLTIVNAASYTAMTGDLAKYFLPIASAIATTITFIYALFAGKFKKLDIWDTFVFMVGVVAMLVWWLYQSASYANFIVVGALAISFWPTFRGVWNNPSTEAPLPWYVWTLAYFFSIMTVLLRWNGSNAELVLPISAFFLHLTVGLLTRRNLENIADKTEHSS